MRKYAASVENCLLQADILPFCAPPVPLTVAAVGGRDAVNGHGTNAFRTEAVLCTFSNSISDGVSAQFEMLARTALEMRLLSPTAMLNATAREIAIHKVQRLHAHESNGEMPSRFAFVWLVISR